MLMNFSSIHGGEKTLEMITVSNKVTKRSSLVKKCLQSHITVHEFPLAIQLLAFKAIPVLKKKLTSTEDERTFTDRSIRQLAQLRTFHYKVMDDVEKAEDLQVEPIIHTSLVPNISEMTWDNEVDDPAVDYLESVVKAGDMLMSRRRDKVVPNEQKEDDHEVEDEAEDVGSSKSSIQRLLRLSKKNQEETKNLIAKEIKQIRKEMKGLFSAVEEVRGMISGEKSIKGKEKNKKLSKKRSSHRREKSGGKNKASHGMRRRLSLRLSRCSWVSHKKINRHGTNALTGRVEPLMDELNDEEDDEENVNVIGN